MRSVPITTLSLCAMVFVASDVLCQVADQETEDSSMKLLEKILTDAQLWGVDAFALFSSLDRWQELGESSILVFPDRVASGTPFASAEKAEESAARMVEFMGLAHAQMRPAFAELYVDAIETKAPHLRAEYSEFLEDDSYRVVWKSPEGEFLKKELKLKAVIAQYGEPERKTTQVVHARGERRPAILTNYHYADGAVVFVESDLAPTPGLVDRVVLDVAAAAGQIFAP